MSPVRSFIRLFFVLLVAFPLVLNGCSYIPWIGNDDEDDLAFEDDFPFEEEEEELARRGSSEDDFFAEETGFGDSDDGFASLDQRTDRNELKGDVENLQTQQEALISKVRELEEVIRTLEPRLEATQERLEGSLGIASSQSEFLEPEVEELKMQVARLNEEIAGIKSGQVRKPASRRARPRSASKTPEEYNRALAAYKSGDYDESILLFQNYALSDPPPRLQDNILFWIGSNYVQLEMFDDAIKQFEAVLEKYPRGNKIHDSRFMLGVSYQKKGESSRAIEILESALKRQPPAEVRGKIRAQLKTIQ